MKFLCGSCRTKYQISDEKVRGKILTIRCKKCGAKILVRESLAQETEGGAALAPVAGSEVASEAPERRPSSSGRPASVRDALAAAYETAMERGPAGEADDMPTSIAPVPADAGLAGFEWYLAIDGQQHGPFAFAELVEKAQKSEIMGRHYVWHDGMADWKRVREVPDLAAYLGPLPSGTPPPPPRDAEARGGEVVDFAGRREKQDTDVDAPAVTSEGSEAPTEKADAGAASPLDPAADLQTPAAEHPTSAASSAPSSGPTPDPETTAGGGSIAAAGTVPEGTRPDLSLDLEDEDIFANVPRASAQEIVQRESTKFFVAAAGVQNQKKRTRLGYYLAAGTAALLLGFVGLWYAGIIRISLPGIGNPFAAGYETTAQVYEGGPDDSANYELLIGDVATKPAAQEESKRGGSRRTARARRERRMNRVDELIADGSAIDELGDGEYLDETESGLRRPGSARREASEEASVSIDSVGSKIDVPEGRGLTPLPEADLTVPPPDVENLDARTIQRVVSSKKASVRICYEKSLKAKEQLQGKLQVSLVVEPGGNVARAWITSPAFKGSVVGRCILGSIRNWRFPKFAGAAQEIELPFVFQRGA